MKKSTSPQAFPYSTLLLVGALAGAPRAAAADFLDLRITSYGNVTNQTAKDALDTLVDTLATNINANFPDVDLVPFTKGTARATAIASSGVGTEYASDFDFGYLGVNLALAMDNATVAQIKELANGDINFENAPGVAAVGAVTLGLSFKNLPKIPLPLIDTSRGKGYLSFFSRSQTITPSDPNSPSLRVGMTTFAAHGQYKLVEGVSYGLGTLKWTGVQLTGGLRYTKSNVQVRKSMSGLDATTTVDPGNGNPTDVTAAFTGDGVVGISSKVFSVPMEISTSVRLLHVLSLFAGTGADINLGGANANLTIDSPITFTDSDGVLTGVTAQADGLLDANGGPGAVNVKYFGGIQAEVLALAVSVQVNGSLTNSAKGVNVGVKAFW